MATRSPTPFHSFWGSYTPPGSPLPSGTRVEVGDTAYDTTLGSLVVCTSVGPVVWTPAGVGSAFYPDPASALLAWDFSGTAASIPNLGSLVSPDADMTTIGTAVVRDVPGPVNGGVGVYGTAANSQVNTSQGAVNLGSSLFTNAITMAVFFDLSFDPSAGTEYNALIKGWKSSSWVAPLGSGIGWYAGTFFGQVLVSGGATRQTTVVPGQTPAGAYGFRPGLHMAAYTYDGQWSRLYFDGVEVASADHGSVANIQLGDTVGTDEGPWNVGGNYAVSGAGMRGVVYAARVYNAVQSAAWVKQVWKNANGWT